MDFAFNILRCGELHLTLWVHAVNDPTSEEWVAAITRLVDLKQQLGGDISSIRCLALTDGGAPNALQRKELASGVLEGNARAAALSTVLSNRLKRGIATAVSWLNPNFRAFPPSDHEQALEHLNLENYSRQVLAELGRLHRIVPTHTFEMIRNHADAQK